MEIKDSNLPAGISSYEGNVGYNKKNKGLSAICSYTGRVTTWIVSGSIDEGLQVDKCTCAARGSTGYCKIKNSQCNF